jgi:hypothetical protein
MSKYEILKELELIAEKQQELAVRRAQLLNFLRQRVEEEQWD